MVTRTATADSVPVDPTGDPEPNTGDRRGFTIVEVVIALIVLTVGVLGLAGTTAYIVRQVTLADVMTKRAAAFQTTIDHLQALPYANVTSGSDSVGDYSVQWTAVDDGSQSRIVTIVTVGPGLTTVAGAFPYLASQVADTFKFRVLRP